MPLLCECDSQLICDPKSDINFVTLHCPKCNMAMHADVMGWSEGEKPDQTIIGELIDFCKGN